MAQGPVQGLDHQSGIHMVIQHPADDTAAEQVDQDRQIPQASTGADVGDVSGPAAVGSRGLELLLEHVLHHSGSPTAGLVAGPERLAAPGPELGSLHEPGDAMAADVMPQDEVVWLFWTAPE